MLPLLEIEIVSQFSYLTFRRFDISKTQFRAFVRDFRDGVGLSVSLFLIVRKCLGRTGGGLGRARAAFWRCVCAEASRA